MVGVVGAWVRGVKVMMMRLRGMAGSASASALPGTHTHTHTHSLTHPSPTLVTRTTRTNDSYDGTVRNSAGDVVQFLYGEDGMDGVRVEGQALDHLKVCVCGGGCLPAACCCLLRVCVCV